MVAVNNPQHWDVVIVGAGISGIGAACRIRSLCPQRSFTILEARDTLGGTWDFFKYPGLRSDSDMFTFGYSFNPWPHADTLAEGKQICEYLKDTAEKCKIIDAIQYNQWLQTAAWHSDTGRWQLNTSNQVLSCSFLFFCSGYYKYDGGHTPEWPGMQRFEGKIIHPQRWPEDENGRDKRVIVVGSGATAITLVPKLVSNGATEVTVVQRSPSYVLGLPARDPIVPMLKGKVSYAVVYQIALWARLAVQFGFFKFCKTFPQRAKSVVIGQTAKGLSKGFDMKHFTPRYNPWDQRLCFCPGGDFLKSIRRGQASILTDEIETFTETGVVLKSGETIDCDMVVTATGMNLHDNYPMSDVEVSVDGRSYDPTTAVIYRGSMLSDVPNFAFATGVHDQLSWTLKSDLIARYVCRLLNHMDSKGYGECRPTLAEDVKLLPWMPLSSTYFQRSADRLPKEGSRAPWDIPENFFTNRRSWLYGSLHEEMAFVQRSPVPARL